MDASAPTEARRSSIEKPPLVIDTQPFDRLPDEIIEQILQATDASGFASLIVLNRKWRDVSQRTHLYLHHLRLCPSYVANPGGLPSADDKNLPRLRRLFASEIKRNLFESYIRPNETVIKLVSNSISSSSAPGGEGMQFAASPRGHYMLAYNSSRIHVIDLRVSRIEVKRELKILRRPVSACITDDATLLAVLSTGMQIDLFDLTRSPPRRKQSMILDNNPRTIALSSCGSVLAVAYDSGIEVSSLKPGALPTERRAVRCDAVDTLAFSFDGTQILGTTLHSSPPSTVVITAPYYDPGALAGDENLSSMWTTSILFPNSSRDCSHAVLLQDGSQEEAAWAFVYDSSFETFRSVRIDDLRNGTTYFTGPVPKTTSQAKLLPSTLPSATYRGELVSAGFQGNEIWIYGVPEDLTAVPEAVSSNIEGSASTSGLARHGSNSSRPSSIRTHDAAAAAIGRVPQWQIICDKLRNNFVAGYKVSDITSVSNVKWVSGFGDTSFKERLVVTARGITAPRLITDEEDMDFVDGGRIVLLDFDYGLTNGTKTEITIDVGTTEAEALEEEQRDIETEVAIVRRRTVAQKRGGGSHSLLRTATATAQSLAPPPPLPQTQDNGDDDPLIPRVIGQNPASHHPASRHPVQRPVQEPTADEDVLSIEEQEAMDAPYAHSSPRSGTTLRRAATAAATNRRLNPRTADGRPIEYRRADGRREHPHESDADNWVPPPPPYQKEDPGDMPAFMRAPAVLPPLSGPGLLVPSLAQTFQPRVPATFSSPPNLVVSTNFTARGMEQGGYADEKQGPSYHRTVSDSTIVSRSRVDETPLPQSSTSGPLEADNLYDVSPPESPHPRGSQSGNAPLSRIELNRVDTWSTTETRPMATTGSMSATSVQSNSVEVSPIIPRRAVQASSSTPGSDTASMRRLSTVQTWPLAPRPERLQELSTTAAADLATTALPPAPSSDQLARLNRRISQGTPRRLSGGLLAQNLTPHHPSGEGVQEIQQPTPIYDTTFASTTSRPEFDQPLIISTPKGVSGAFDPPGRRTSQRGDMPIFAPVPRRPRPGPGSSSRPTVERFETIYNVRSNSNEAVAAAAAQANTNLVPGGWVRKPAVSPGRSTSIVNRRPSRAERSAAKNILDARKRGWKGKNKKRKDTNKTDAEAASSTGWTDVSVTSGLKETNKDKKCVVM